MKSKILFDTNELLDWLIASRNNNETATEIVKLVFQKKIQGFVTSHSLTDIFYITRKDFTVEERKELIILLLHNFTVLVEDKHSFLEVLNSDSFFDLEDGLQMQSAAESLLDYIVTENLQDFESSKVNVVNAQGLLKILNKKND